MKKLLAQILRTFLIFFCKLITGTQAHWKTKPNENTRIYYSNHSSHLDGIVIWSALPKHLREKVHPVAAKDYWTKNAFLKFIAIDVFNSVLVERKPNSRNDLLQELEDVLSQNHSLLLFPEGTRGNGEEISNFKSGLFYLSKKFPNAELIPVYLNNLNRVLPKGSSLLVPIICSVFFGTSILPVQNEEKKEEFLNRAKNAIEEMIL